MRTLNVKLLAWLGGISLLSIVGLYGLNRFQVQRNAHYLLELADEAEKKDDTFAAVRHIKRYLAFDPLNADANARYALLLTEFVESSESTVDQYQDAYVALETVLRRFPDRDDVARRLADYAPRLGRLEIAIEQYEKLLKKEPSDAEELRLKLGMCYEGNDDNEQALNLYQQTIDSSPANLDAHVRKARLLRSKLNEPVQADETIDQMVVANENVAGAYLERARYLQETRLTAGTQSKFEQMTQRLEDDVAKALQLAPDDQEALIFAGEYKLQTRGSADARDHFVHLLEVQPDNLKARRWLAILDWNEGKKSEGVQQLKAIYEDHPDEKEIQWFLADYQLRNQETAAARETIEKVRAVRDFKKRLPGELIDLLEARVMMNERKFSDAVKLLDSVRPRMVRDPVQAIQVDLYMAACYAELGQPDLQLQSYQRALLLDPTSIPARKGLGIALSSQGRIDEAIAELEQIVARDPEVTAILIQLQTQRLSRAGGSEDDLEKIKKVLEKFRERGDAGNAAQVDVDLIEINVLAAQGNFTEAKAKLLSKIEQDPEAVNPRLAMADLALRADGPDAALEVLDQALAKLPDNLQLKLARVDVLSRAGKDEARKNFAVGELRKILSDAESFPEEQQTGFWDKVGTAFVRLGETEEAKRLWKQVAERRPSDPQAHLRVFAIMMDAKDEAGVDGALDGLRNNLGETSAEYNYAEAARRIGKMRREGVADDLLKAAEDYLNRGLQQRPQWHVLHTALAEIEALRGNEPRAIEKYQESIQLGERSSLHIRALVGLLTKAERWDEVSDAIKLMESVGGDTDDLAVVGFIASRDSGGNVDDDPRIANRVEQTDNARELVVLGQLLFERRDWPGAENAFTKAVGLAPEAPEGWISLVSLFRATNRPAQADKTAKEAADKLAAEVRPLALARCYEVLDKPDEAQKYYEEALAAKPDELRIKRQAAAFYIGRGEKERAQQLLDTIIAAAATADSANLVHVEWARRQSARLVAGKGGYKNLQAALELIDQNVRASGLAYEDLVFKAELIGRRPDVQSKKEAAELYEQAKLARKRLPPQQTLQLAQLYDRLGEWEKCREEMLRLLTEAPENSGFQAIYIEMLLRHGELNEAQPRIDQLVAADPNSMSSIEAKSRLLVMQGKVADAVALLESVIPRPLPPGQANTLRTIAGFMVGLARNTSVEDAKPLRAAAERLLREYVTVAPQDEMMFANFIGEYGDLNESLTICQKYVDAGNIQAPIEICLANFRSRRAEVTPEQFSKLESWIERARREIKGPFVAKFFEADLRDIQGRYDDTEAIYREILKQEGLRDAETVTALNNLAYIVAMRDNNGQEAIKLIEQAISINGPMAELLDTRGMVRLSLNDPAEAIRDLEAALVESPDWLKFLHLAVAQMRSGRSDALIEAYRESERRGLNEKLIPPLERKIFTEVRQEYGAATRRTNE